MKNRKLLLIVIILAVLTILLAFAHLSSREEIAEGNILLTVDGTSRSISLADLNYQFVSGIRVNGKGEEIPVSGQGISLLELIKRSGVEQYKTVTVLSDDSYSATVSVDEVQNANFLLEDGHLRLIVFGDSDSKRSVSNVEQIMVELN